MNLDMKQRVQKLMAQADFGSRRTCEEIIEQGRVTVNGKVITLGAKADPYLDDIRVDGEKLRVDKVDFAYYVINKPRNVLSAPPSDKDDDRPLVRDLIDVEGHLFTIGRLDAESEGLMVLTNDGDMAHQLAHPRYEHTKTYKVTVYGEPDEETLERWQNGVYLKQGERTAPCYVKVLETNKETSVLRVVMIEGKKRQIRRTAALLGHPVKRLVRTHIGQLGLGTLRQGQWYQLDEENEVYFMTQPAPELEAIRKRRQAFKRQRKYKKKARRERKRQETQDKHNGNDG